MKHTIRRLLGVFAFALWAVPCAQGQQIPPIEEGDPIVRTTLINGRLTMTDVENEHQIILPAGVVFRNFGPGITGDVRLQEQPTGFDLICTFENTGVQAATMGRLMLTKFNLGNNIHYRDYRYTGAPKAVDYNNYSFQAFHYPSQLYSPVWTLFNDDYTLSVSVQYPIMDYRHDVRVMLGSSPANEDPIHGPRGWFLEYRFANLGGETPQGVVQNPGEIPAGETRTYVVSLRITKNANEWIRTLVPYRDYFRSLYGGVRYERDARPIKPLLLAVSHLISETNPYGFDNFGNNRRPDLYGFRPWTDYIKQNAERWPRVMLWTPTGLYNENRNMNYPFEFTTRWLTEERMANVFDDEVGLPSVGRAGTSLGLWWGRALQVSRGWNSGQYEDFDPDNPAHVRAAFDELDLAVRAGAKEIGLDTFTTSHTPIWKLVPWLLRMQEAYPGVKFSSEPVTNDILHRLGPTYVCGWTQGPVERPEDIYNIHGPFYLADLLLPGHESWGAFSYHRHRDHHFPVTPELVQQDAERLASWGYVPLMYNEIPRPENLRAAESWLTTLPPDVLRGSGWNQNYGGPRAFRRPDGRLVIIGEGGAPPRPTGPSGRVAGTGPGGSPEEPPMHEPGAGGDGVPGGVAGDDAPVRSPITRAQRKYNVDLRIQRNGEDVQAGRVRRDPAEATGADLPGSRDTIAVPRSAGARGKGGKGSNPAWLEELAKKGYMNKSQINKAVKELPSSNGPATVVPGKK